MQADTPFNPKVQGKPLPKYWPSRADRRRIARNQKQLKGSYAQRLMTQPPPKKAS